MRQVGRLDRGGVRLHGPAHEGRVDELAHRSRGDHERAAVVAVPAGGDELVAEPERVFRVDRPPQPDDRDLGAADLERVADGDLPVGGGARVEQALHRVGPGLGPSTTDDLDPITGVGVGRGQRVAREGDE